MACLWILHEVFVLFLFWNLPTLKRQLDMLVVKETMQQSSVSLSSSTGDVNDSSSTIVVEPTSSSVIANHHHSNQSSPVTISPNTEQHAPSGATPNSRPRPMFEVGSGPLILSNEQRRQQQNVNLSSSSAAIVGAEQYMSTSPPHLQYEELLKTNAYNSNNTHINSNEQQQNSKRTNTSSSAAYGACDDSTEESSKDLQEKPSSHVTPPVKITSRFFYDGKKIFNLFIVAIDHVLVKAHPTNSATISGYSETAVVTGYRFSLFFF